MVAFAKALFDRPVYVQDYNPWRTWTNNSQALFSLVKPKPPIRQRDWPLSLSYPRLPVYGWYTAESGNTQLPANVVKPFRQQDWLNPKSLYWYREWSQNLLETTLRPTTAKPFNQKDWSLPVRYPYTEETWWQALVLHMSKPVIQQLLGGRQITEEEVFYELKQWWDRQETYKVAEDLSKLETYKAAQDLSKLGASKGGLERAKSLTAQVRSDIASKAAQARWKR